MRPTRDLIAVCFLILVFIAGGLLLGGRGTSPPRTVGAEEHPNPSLTNDRASGSKGVYEWTAKLGYRPTPWRQHWEQLTAGESGASGHTAILLSSRLPSGQSGSKPSSDDQNSFADALDLVVESASPATGRTEFAPLLPVTDTQGVLSLHTDAESRLTRRASDGLALFGDSAGPLALEVPVGRGRLIAVADSRLFSNENLGKSENSVFYANLLAHYAHPGESVLFDEFHHGDVSANASGSLWETLGHPLQLALLQLLPAALCLLLLLGGRFGPPVPLSRGNARTSADYVASVASLYRRAEASGTALETLYRQFLRDVCGRLALPPDVNLERLAEVASQRGQVNKEQMRRLLATCEMRLDAGKVTESELLDLTRQMESIRKEIGIA
jgi:hypothetical protein